MRSRWRSASALRDTVRNSSAVTEETLRRQITDLFCFHGQAYRQCSYQPRTRRRHINDPLHRGGFPRCVYLAPLALAPTGSTRLWHHGRVTDKSHPSRFVWKLSLREAALELMEHAKTLIAKSAKLEKRIARLKPDNPKPAEGHDRLSDCW